MDRAYLEIIFLCGMVLQVIMLLPFLPKYIAKKYRVYFNKKERLYLVFVAITYLLLPFIYVFSTWFSWFDYNFPKWFGFPAILLYGFGFWLFFRAYTDLGSSWSPGLEIKEGHKLVTTGLYKWVRHPMYAALGAVAVSQIFILQNGLVGPGFLIVGIPFYMYRVQREEKQLIRYFGEEYGDYRKQTNAIIPKTEQLDFPQIMEKLKSIVSKNRLKKLVKK